MFDLIFIRGLKKKNVIKVLFFFFFFFDSSIFEFLFLFLFRPPTPTFWKFSRKSENKKMMALNPNDSCPVTAKYDLLSTG